MKLSYRNMIIAGLLVLTLFLLTAVISMRILEKRNIPASKIKTLLLLEKDRFQDRITGERPQGRRSFPSEFLIRQRVRMGVNYLVNHQLDDGQFTYWYDPLEDYASPDIINNILRQTGTTWSMLRAYRYLDDPAILASAEKALGYLLLHQGYFKDSLAYFAYKGKAKLGGVALAAIALIEHADITGSIIHAPLTRDLLHTIGWLQDAQQEGGFQSILFYADEEYDPGWESIIYPGEALLALAYAYDHFGDREYLDRFNRGLDHYHRRGRWKNHGYLAWTCQALARMYRLTGDTFYRERAFRYAGYMLKQQNMNQNREYYGSFYGIPSISSASSLEGIGAVMAWACQPGVSLDCKQLYRHYGTGLAWIMHLQYGFHEIRDFPAGNKVLGGFRYHENDPIIRIDYVQHAISAMIWALEMKGSAPSEDLSEFFDPANRDHLIVGVTP